MSFFPGMFPAGVVLKESGLVLIDRTLGTNIGDMTEGGGLVAAFDGTTNQGFGDCAFKSGASVWVGKTLASPKRFGQAVIHGSNDAGYQPFDNLSMTINIRGKAGTAPSSATDGTIIGTITFTDTGDESAGRTIESTDLATVWDHIFAQLTSDGGSGVAELVLFEWD